MRGLRLSAGAATGPLKECDLVFLAHVLTAHRSRAVWKAQVTHGTHLHHWMIAARFPAFTRVTMSGLVAAPHSRNCGVACGRILVEVPVPIVLDRASFVKRVEPLLIMPFNA
jgi:hypothetical protein